MSVDRDPAGPSIAWLGHATVRIDIDGMSVLTDPLLRDDLGPLHRYAPSPSPEMWGGTGLALISHLHRDHLDLPSLQAFDPYVPVVVPDGAGDFVRRAGRRAVIELAPGESTTVGPLEIIATPARHTGRRPPLGPQAAAVGYIVRGTSAVHFAGDTGLFPEMGDLAAEAIDVALLPVGGWGPTLGGDGHLDPVRAVEALRRIRPRVAVPVHWGTFWPRGLRWVRSGRFSRPGHDFADAASTAVPDMTVAIMRPGLRAASLLPAEDRAM